MLEKLALGGQAFIAAQLFDPLISVLAIIVKHDKPSVGLFTHTSEHELGLDRRETD